MCFLLALTLAAATAAPLAAHAATGPPPPQKPHRLPYAAIGSVDVGTGESSIFLFNNTRYLLDNIFCGYIDHYGQWDSRFRNHSYVRIRNFDTGQVIANVTESIGTSFVSAFVDHAQPGGDVLWLSGSNGDRCGNGAQASFPNQTGVLSISSHDLTTFHAAMAAPGVQTCNTEVARVEAVAPGLPPHKYVMIIEQFDHKNQNMFLVNNNQDGNLSHGWVVGNGSNWKSNAAVGQWDNAAPGGGPSIRWEGSRYYVITGGREVQLCRSRDLGLKDKWQCKLMILPTGRGGSGSGPGDGAIAPYVGFAKDAKRKEFDVLAAHLDEWDWNSNDADVCCSGGSVGAFIIWGASTQGGASKLPPGVPGMTNAIGFRNSTLQELLEAFF